MEHDRSWVFYGMAGTGKTTILGSFPKPMLLIDVQDRGTDSISDVDGITVVRVSEWEDMEEVYMTLLANPGRYKTVGVDTITQGQRFMVEEAAGDRALKQGKNPGDWGTMTKQDWGTIAGTLKSWVTKMRNLPMEVVFLAQQRVFNVDEDAVTGEDGALEPEMGPSVSPAVMTQLCSAVDVIGHTFIREREIKIKKKGKTVTRYKKEFSVRLGPNPYYITKIRKPQSTEVPDFLVNPTHEDILELILGE